MAISAFSSRNVSVPMVILTLFNPGVSVVAGAEVLFEGSNFVRGAVHTLVSGSGYQQRQAQKILTQPNAVDLK